MKRVKQSGTAKKPAEESAQKSMPDQDIAPQAPAEQFQQAPSSPKPPRTARKSFKEFIQEPGSEPSAGTETETEQSQQPTSSMTSPTPAQKPREEFIEIPLPNLSIAEETPAEQPPQTTPRALSPQERKAQQAPAEQPAKTPSDKRRPTLLMQRVWEPNEKAFTLLAPKGWKTAGGIFNVNPLETNGPGNTMSPKCDFTIKSDERGAVMLRWVPAWNYADLTFSPTGWGLFRPGSYYQGMLAKPMQSPKDFLVELFRTTRPQATDMRIIAEDPMREIVEAYAKAAQQTNMKLQQLGLRPTSFEALGIVVEYTEGGTRFREALMTTIADARAGAFMWSNDDTVVLRAPAGEFETWKPVLDAIRASKQMNPQWVAAVARAQGERAQNWAETQRYINRVASEIVENRRRTHAEIRHEQWLFISGQEEYTNPFSGQAERGTSAYRYRWVNNQGDVLYTDENSFDPNRHEEYNTREWKRTAIRER